MNAYNVVMLVVGLLVHSVGDAFAAEPVTESSPPVASCLSDALWASYAAAGEGQILPVLIWLAVFEPEQDKTQLTDMPWLADSFWAELEFIHLPYKEAVLSHLDSLGALGYFEVLQAPAVVAELTFEEAASLCLLPEVATIYELLVPEPCGTTYKQTIQTPTSLTGAGIGVCVIEADQPSTPNHLELDDLFCEEDITNDHGRAVAGIIRDAVAPYGIAPDAIVDFASWGPTACGSNAGPAREWCGRPQRSPDSNNTVWNWSHTCDEAGKRLFDYWAKHPPYPFIVVAAGNKWSGGGGAVAETKCEIYNGLVVGSSDEHEDSARGNDTAAFHSCSLNPAGTDWEVPNVVAPGVDITADNLTGSGTSAAAPQVAAAGAIIQQYNPTTKEWPELVRALVMVGATENVDGPVLDLDDNVDDRDGAGEISISRSVIVASPGNKRNGGEAPSSTGYDYGLMRSSDVPAPGWYPETYHAKTTHSNLRLRVVLTWDSTATCTDPADAGSCTSDVLDGDLDLYVYNSQGTKVCDSLSYDSPFEFCEFNAAAYETYSIRIRVYSWNASSTYFAIAWQFDTYSVN